MNYAEKKKEKKISDAMILHLMKENNIKERNKALAELYKKWVAKNNESISLTSLTTFIRKQRKVTQLYLDNVKKEDIIQLLKK